MALHPESRTYAGFQWRDRFYVYNVLPFGMATAPRCFSKVMGLLVRHWRSTGIRMITYLDDWWFVVGADEARRVLDRVLADCRRARIRVNLEKSQLDPTRTLVHLGFEINLNNNTFCASVPRWTTLQEDISELLRAGHASARAIYGVAGKLISLSLALGPVAQIFTRHMYAWGSACPSWDRRAPIPPDVRDELIFWSGVPRLRYTSPIFPTTAGRSGVPVYLAVDASDRGWGAHLINSPATPAHGFFSPEERAESSTHREVRGHRS